MMGLLHKNHILCGGKEGVGQDIAEGQLVEKAANHHLSKIVILGLGTDPPLLTRFLFGDPFRLFDQLQGHREGNVVDMIQAGEEVDAFDIASQGMIPMPTDQFALIGTLVSAKSVKEDRTSAGRFRKARLPQASRRQPDAYSPTKWSRFVPNFCLGTSRNIYWKA